MTRFLRVPPVCIPDPVEPGSSERWSRNDLIIFLVSRVAYGSTYRVKTRNGFFDCPIGQFSMGLRHLAELSGWPKRSLEDFFREEVAAGRLHKRRSRPQACYQFDCHTPKTFPRQKTNKSSKTDDFDDIREDSLGREEQLAERERKYSGETTVAGLAELQRLHSLVG